jgi:hypothetical protein
MFKKHPVQKTFKEIEIGTVFSCSSYEGHWFLKTDKDEFWDFSNKKKRTASKFLIVDKKLSGYLETGLSTCETLV